jgi:hypothetical protein
MRCPNCHEDGLSFWRIWLFNLRQRIDCTACEVQWAVLLPGKVAAGTIVMLLASAAAYFSQGGRGLGFVLMLFALVANFLLTHHFVELVVRDED